MASVFVIGDPTRTIQVEIRANIFSVLARCFRSYLGEIAAAWLGALLALSACDMSSKGTGSVGRNKFAFLALWFFISTLFSTQQEAVVRGDLIPPCLPILALLHFLGAGLALTSQYSATMGGKLFGVCCTCCRRGKGRGSTEGGSISWMLTKLLVLVCLALVHPSGCLLILGIFSLVLLGREHRKVSSLKVDLDENPTDVFEEKGSWTSAVPLRGIGAVLLGPYLLCHLPSLILTIWLTLGQQKEASIRYLQSELDGALPFSKHAASVWADSLFFASGPDMRNWSLMLPALGLVAPAVALSCLSTGARKQEASVQNMAAGIMFVLSCLTAFAGSSTSHLWIACQPALIVHAILPVLSFLDQHQKEVRLEAAKTE
eukprot:TRINITY_DN9328_c0_g1_i4.p1 TRINITY_DN9328_c0_g1~~TRINITY_DN9328_c0_g1_i4.p1  ORF type:complete len:401 (-),score=53.81 TRINITY_DN9328_c0_g1_i4:331-1452(-)